MDRVVMQSQVVAEVVAEYAKGRTWKGVSHFIADHQRAMYAVIVVRDVPRPFPARVVVMARVVGEHVVIDEDTTDRPLVTALVAAGIPREQIVLLYAGETLPEFEPSKNDL